MAKSNPRKAELLHRRDAPLETRTDLTPQARSANSFLSRVAASSIRQDKDFLAIDEIEQRFFGAIGKIHPPHSDSNHVGAGSNVRAPHLLKAAIFPSPHNKSRLKGAPSDYKQVRHGEPHYDFRTDGGISGSEQLFANPDDCSEPACETL